MSIFTDAQKSYAQTFPRFAKAGWGPFPKAERWNGRHAMFGWVAIIATGYAQAHGLFPNPDMPLSADDWGTLAIVKGGKTITNERATILIAHLQVVVVSVCAAAAPFDWQDNLFNKPGEKNEPNGGYLPPLETGLSKGAELYNGRMAMLGLITTTAYSLYTHTPFLKVVDMGLGGMLYGGN